MKLTGKTIRIIDKRTIIINLGSEDGIDESCIFSIMGEPEKIIDPETKENLGEVTIVKSKVKAKEVAEKFTIATTKWKNVNLGVINAMAETIGRGFETVETDEGELNVANDDLKPWIAKAESFVKVGDIVEVRIKEKVTNEKKHSKNTNLKKLGNNTKG